MTAVHSHHNPVGRLAGEHPAIEKFGRIGWLAKGVVYIVAGVLALLIAAKASGWSDSASGQADEASPTGALKTIAHASGGVLLMWLLTIGMLTYAAWRVVSAALPAQHDAKSTLKRIGYVVSAVIYTTFAFTALSLARSKSSQPGDAAAANPDGNTKVTSLSQQFMGHSGGRLLIGLVGLIVIAVGIYRVVKGLHQDVNDELDLSQLSAERRRWTERLGSIGEVGRGIGIGLVGFFLTRAAMTYDANEATGLDGALRRLATQSWGLLVVVVVGIGFAAYGVFCVATFTHRKLQSA